MLLKNVVWFFMLNAQNELMLKLWVSILSIPAFEWLIEWCFTPLLTVFQSYHGDSSHYSCHSWVSPVLGWALKCLAQGHSHEKTQRIQCGSNPAPLDYKSNTLLLSHTGSLHSNEDCVFSYKHDLKSEKTMFVGVNGLLSLINIIKTNSNNLLSNHTYRNYVP